MADCRTLLAPLFCWMVMTPRAPLKALAMTLVCVVLASVRLLTVLVLPETTAPSAAVDMADVPAPGDTERTRCGSMAAAKPASVSKFTVRFRIRWAICAGRLEATATPPICLTKGTLIAW